jgi:hypothetical protein
VFVVERVRGRDDDAVESGMADEFFRGLGGEGEAEMFLDAAQLVGAEPADGGQLDVVAFGEQGYVIAVVALVNLRG